MYDTIKLSFIAQSKGIVKKTTTVKKVPKIVTVIRSEEEVSKRFRNFLRKTNKQFLYKEHYKNDNSKLWTHFIELNKYWLTKQYKRVPIKIVSYNFK